MQQTHSIDTQLVIQANPLSQKILFPYMDPLHRDLRDLPLTALQHKVILFLISLVDPDAQHLDIVRLPITELARIVYFDIGAGGRNRAFFISALNDLVGKRLYLYENGDLICLTWLNKAVYHKDGTVTLQLHDDLLIGDRVHLA